MATGDMINDEVYVCTNCYMDHHEGRAMADTSVDWTDNNSDPEDETGDTRMTKDFSSMPCGCCGTTVAGARHRMAIWEL
jgi:hypothetical protein